jgi:hypothetical protein
VRSTIGLRATPTRLGILGEDEGAACDQFACAVRRSMCSLSTSKSGYGSTGAASTR